MGWKQIKINENDTEMVSIILSKSVQISLRKLCKKYNKKETLMIIRKAFSNLLRYV